jgi:hypothetical protein
MAIKNREGISAHQHPRAVVSEIRMCTNIILVLDFDDIRHDIQGRARRKTPRLSPMMSSV